jgi:hypothetical protein
LKSEHSILVSMKILLKKMLGWKMSLPSPPFP